MSQSNRLRETREGTIINEESKVQEIKMQDVSLDIINNLQNETGLTIHLKKRIMLKDIVALLQGRNPNQTYAQVKATTYLQPDGGVIYLTDKDNNMYPILIGEVKKQGTNDKRQEEGKEKQAQGNAVERLGKNVIGFKQMVSNEDYTPFVCFGEGCDFAEGSSILDRVHTIACFRPINCIDTDRLSMGSFFFREEKWTKQEMYDIMYAIASQAIDYYVQKYGEIFV